MEHMQREARDAWRGGPPDAECGGQSLTGQAPHVPDAPVLDSDCWSAACAEVGAEARSAWVEGLVPASRYRFRVCVRAARAGWLPEDKTAPSDTVTTPGGHCRPGGSGDAHTLTHTHAPIVSLAATRPLAPAPLRQAGRGPYHLEAGWAFVADGGRAVEEVEVAAVECCAPCGPQDWTPPPLPDDDTPHPSAEAGLDVEGGWVWKRSLLAEGAIPPFAAAAPTGPLDPGRYYIVRARARNGLGWGPWSLSSPLWRTKRACRRLSLLSPTLPLTASHPCTHTHTHNPLARNSSVTGRPGVASAARKHLHHADSAVVGARRARRGGGGVRCADTVHAAAAGGRGGGRVRPKPLQPRGADSRGRVRLPRRSRRPGRARGGPPLPGGCGQAPALHGGVDDRGGGLAAHPLHGSLPALRASHILAQSPPLIGLPHWGVRGRSLRGSRSACAPGTRSAAPCGHPPPRASARNVGGALSTRARTAPSLTRVPAPAPSPCEAQRRRRRRARRR